MSSRGAPFFLLNQSIMNHLEDQTPFVQATLCIAITAGWTVLAPPVQYLVQRLAHERLFFLNVAQQPFGIIEIFAHRGVACVTRTRKTFCGDNSIPLLGRAEL